MLVLRSSPSSPFARKVRIAADLLGIAGRLELVSADTNDPNDPLRRDNPLGKLPVLVLEDGSSIYDSAVIVAYLDQHATGPGLIPDGAARFPALVHEGLADGIMDAAILQVYEGRWRAPDRHDAPWLAHQAGKVARALAFAETAHSEMPAKVHVGHVAQACALGYLDFRFNGEWRAAHPRLVAWLDAFAAQVPAFGATRPPT